MKFMFIHLWAVVTFYEADGKTHHYILTVPDRDVQIALTTPTKLPSEVNQWVRVKGPATCEKINSSGNTTFSRLLCNSELIENDPCQHMAQINGYNYCIDQE